MEESQTTPCSRKVELAQGVSIEVQPLIGCPDTKVVVCCPNERSYTAIVLIDGSPSYEELIPVEHRMNLNIEIADFDFIVLTGRYLPSTMVLWYTIGHYVERAGQWLSISSLAMSCLKYPGTALALAVGGCAFWGIHNRQWNAAITANYELEPCGMNERLHPFLKDKIVLRKKKKEKSKSFNVSTVLTACATAVAAAGVFLWARQKF